MKLSAAQIQKTILSPSMQQSIELLLLPLGELSTAIDQELQENPLLEVAEPAANDDLRLDDMVQYLKEDQGYTTPAFTTPEDEYEDRRQAAMSRSVSLEDHLLQQLRFEVNEPLDTEIGEMIIGNLTDEGYLNTTCEAIAQGLKLADSERVEHVLRIVQRLDPLAIAARDLKECLLIQLPYHFNGKSQMLEILVGDHLEDLGNKRYTRIARAMKVSVDDVKQMAKAVALLEPLPARNYRPFNANIYIKPDVKIYKDAQGVYQIQINKESVPKLRVSSSYRALLKQGQLSKDDAVFIKEKVRNALLFMKSIESRHQTIRKIATYILEHQQAFFDHGHRELRPMIMREVAEAIGRNESTVSRAIHHKYMDTPQGLLAMKFFFSQAMGDSPQGATSNRSIKEAIRELIEQEDKRQPYSDKDIQQHFQEKGVTIARRTISKYRQGLRILPSYLRKE